MKRPLVFTGASMLISLTIFGCLGIKSAAVAFVISLITLIVFIILRKKIKFSSAVITCCIFVILSAGLFSIKTTNNYNPSINLCDENTHTISGTVRETYEKYGYEYIVMNVSQIDKNENNVSIRVCSYKSIGAEIDDNVTFENVTLYILGATSGNESYYKPTGTYIGAYGGEKYSVVKAEKHSVLYYSGYVKNKISSSLYKNMNSNYAAIADAMLTGNSDHIEENTLTGFRYSGIAHMFAVSGFHLALWTAVISAICYFIFKKKNKLSVIPSIIFILFYMSVTGFSKSIVRAGIMLIIILVGRLISYKADSLNSLFGALTFILIQNPFALFSVSLQLSFLATLGIILLIKPMTELADSFSDKIKYKWLKRTFTSVYSIICISVIASIFTLPVSSYQFGYFSLISPISNLLCGIPSEIMIVCSGFGVIFSKISAISKPLFFAASHIAKYNIFITGKLSRIKYSVINIDNNAVIIAIWISVAIMIIMLIVFSDKKKKMRFCIYAEVLVIAVISVTSVYSSYNSFSIKAINAGNSSCILISTEDKNALIGCGSKSINSSYKLTSVLNRINSKELDFVLIPTIFETESAFASNVLSDFSCKTVIATAKSFSEEIENIIPEQAIRTDLYTYSLDRNTTLIYINNENFSGVRVENPQIECTILFSPQMPDSISESWSHGNLLIVRGNPSALDTSGFGCVFVESNIDNFYGENTYSTHLSGTLTFRVSQSGNINIKEEYNDF